MPHLVFVSYSYEALGLVASLNPTAPGGVERPLGVASTKEPPVDVNTAPVASSSKLADSSGLPKGFGRIVRDADGNVVDVQLPEEEEEATIDDTDRLIEDIPDPAKQQGLAEWVKLGGSSRTADTHVVQSKSGYRRQSAFLFHSNHVLRAIATALDLEELAGTRGGPVPRHSSSGELGVLRRLVAKYRDDVEAMARDRKLNVDQRTAGQLSRAIKKAGGVAELLKGS